MNAVRMDRHAVRTRSRTRVIRVGRCAATLALLLALTVVGAPSSATAGASTPAVVSRTISAGGTFSLVIKADGSLWSFGVNAYGQLGRAANSGTFTANPTPGWVMDDVVQAAAGTEFSMALDASGTLWTFGGNTRGELGIPYTSGDPMAHPVPIALMSDVRQIAAGAWHAMVLRSDGTLWTFGSNQYGELGYPTTDPFGRNPTPTRIMSDVAQIAAGSAHSLVLKTDGTLWAFGNNINGELGVITPIRDTPHGPASSTSTPVLVTSDVTAIAAGSAHSMALKADGSLWTFGSNGSGQLGIGDLERSSLLSHVMDGVRRVEGGGAHSLVLTTDGALWAFGANGYGQLGLPSADSLATVMSPTKVLTGIVQISAGDSHSLVERADGMLLTFGSNVFGQLGSSVNIGTFIANATPTATVQGVGVPTMFVSSTPARLMDSRQPASPTVDGLFEAIGLRTAGSVTELEVAGRAGVPTDAAAMVLNVTATAARGSGFITVWPCGATRPNASNLNFTSGATIANAVLTMLGSGGRVCVYTETATHVVVDLDGYYPAGSIYVPLTPARLMDSRQPASPTVDGRYQAIGLRSAGSVTELSVAGRAGIPADAAAAVLNVTATAATGTGFITVWPCGTGMPNASSLNFGSGQTIANAVITELGTGGAVCLYTETATHVVVDLDGYYPDIGG